ncbi:unnamed protein product [Cyprideis torosa]|uniref:Uncharacterized protein n=1 Tax=Cyprideis torosa TaxID=163714 RepID=A0A7R8ZGZ1_9CRUS|nr:unnamed protein product [Cyprideis torosa]CAG0882509.1 unnamed protein product [Cyprideis torosa]
MKITNNRNPTKEQVKWIGDSLLHHYPKMRGPSGSRYGGIVKDEGSKTPGSLQNYIRGKRHRDPSIVCSSSTKKARSSSTTTSSELEEANKILREARPSSDGDKKLILEALKVTFPVRRKEVLSLSCTVLDVLQKYPMEFAEAVEQDFQLVAGESLDFTFDLVEKYRLGLRQYAQVVGHSEALVILGRQIAGEGSGVWNLLESLAAIMPNRKMKVKHTPEEAKNCVIKTFEYENVPTAIATCGFSQPGILLVGTDYFVFLEGKVIKPRSNTACSAIKTLMGIIFAFNLQYPAPMRNVFAFLERVLELSKSVHTSCILADSVYKSVTNCIGGQK